MRQFGLDGPVPWLLQTWRELVANVGWVALRVLTRFYLVLQHRNRSPAAARYLPAARVRPESACIDQQWPPPHSPTRSQPLVPWSAGQRVKSLHAPIQGRLPTSVCGVAVAAAAARAVGGKG